MNSVFEKYKWLRFVIGGGIILLGVLIIIFASLKTGNVPIIINIVISVGLMVLGLFLTFSSLLSETHKMFTPSLLLGSISTGLGISILVARFGLHISFSGNLIVYVSSILFIVLGVVALLKAIFLIVYHEKGIMVFAMFIIAAAAITIGILGLCFADNLVTLAYVLMGTALVVLGILFIVFSALQMKKSS